MGNAMRAIFLMQALPFVDCNLNVSNRVTFF